MKKGLICALIVLLADQISKAFVLSYFADHASPVGITSFFNFVLAWNKGVSFSLLHSNHPAMPWVLVTIALLICGVILHWMSMEKNQATINCFGLILGGALGNVIDRVCRGYVVDMLHFQFWPSYPTFNVADICIVCGAILGAVYYVLIYEKHDGRKQNGAADPASGQ